MIVLDGSSGEGGGQILRSALALSLITQRAFRLENIRAGRKVPGLQRQHLASVRAAAEISGATLTGDTLDSQTLVFEPRPVKPGKYKFDIGTAGSTGLVFHTVLYPLALAKEPSEVEIIGGTHASKAPCFDFLRQSFAPALQWLGFPLDLAIHKHGFFPVGQGRMSARISSATPQAALLPEGILSEVCSQATILWARRHKDAEVLAESLRLRGVEAELVEGKSAGPGLGVILVIPGVPFPLVLSSFWERGGSAEATIELLFSEAQTMPVGEFLADQLLLPMALAAWQGRGASEFFTGPISLHTTTNAGIIFEFLGVETRFMREKGRVRVRVGQPG